MGNDQLTQGCLEADDGSVAARSGVMGVGKNRQMDDARTYEELYRLGNELLTDTLKKRRWATDGDRGGPLTPEFESASRCTLGEQIWCTL